MVEKEVAVDTTDNGLDHVVHDASTKDHFVIIDLLLQIIRAFHQSVHNGYVDKICVSIGTLTEL